jgi:hypothetical protein
MAHRQEQPVPVEATSHIQFNKEFKTFSLYSGKSLYSFCVGPELNLEHLYWGTKLDNNYDLRYLSQSCRTAAMDTVEAPALVIGGKIISEAETFEEVQKAWKDNNSLGHAEPCSHIAAVQRRRLENYAWRILSKATQGGSSPSNTREHSTHVLSTPRRSDKTWKLKSAATSDYASMDLFAGRGTDGRTRTATHPLPSGTHDEDTIPITPEQELSDAMKRSAVIDNAPPPALRRLPVRQRRKYYAFDRTTGKLGKNTVCCEYADYGTGDFRTPSFIVVDNLNGSSISPLRYKRHAIYRGKLPMPDAMPAIRCLSEREASTLVVTMADTITGLEVDLVYGE